jgi:hypothetical protein
MQKIVSQRGTEARATSCRNTGRHHLGMPGRLRRNPQLELRRAPGPTMRRQGSPVSCRAFSSVQSRSPLCEQAFLQLWHDVEFFDGLLDGGLYQPAREWVRTCNLDQRERNRRKCCSKRGWPTGLTHVWLFEVSPGLHRLGFAVTAIEIRQCLPVGIAHNVAAGQFAAARQNATSYA